MSEERKPSTSQKPVPAESELAQALYNFEEAFQDLKKTTVLSQQKLKALREKQQAREKNSDTEVDAKTPASNSDNTLRPF